MDLDPRPGSIRTWIAEGDRLGAGPPLHHPGAKQVEGRPVGHATQGDDHHRGAGTGKTTSSTPSADLSRGWGSASSCRATGRAGQAHEQATGHEARTLHRLLEYSMQKGGFQRNEEHPLECDLLIVDEASMIDTLLMYHLVKAVPRGHAPPRGRRQPASLGGAGQRARGPDRVRVGSCGGAERDFPQAEKSLIIVNAHTDQPGVLPALKLPGRGWRTSTSSSRRARRGAQDHRGSRQGTHPAAVSAWIP